MIFSSLDSYKMFFELILCLRINKKFNLKTFVYTNSIEHNVFFQRISIEYEKAREEAAESNFSRSFINYGNKLTMTPRFIPFP